MTEFKSVVIEKIIIQLCNDSKVKFPDLVEDVETFQDAYDWHISVDVVMEDEIAWKRIHAHSDDKLHGSNLIKGIIKGYGINCEDESNRGFIKKLFNFSKRQMRKIMSIKE